MKNESENSKINTESYIASVNSMGTLSIRKAFSSN